jgi:hypothetical protein
MDNPYGNVGKIRSHNTLLVVEFGADIRMDCPWYRADPLYHV